MNNSRLITIFSKIQNRHNTLTKNEKVIFQLLKENTLFFINASIGEIAEKCSISKAGITRFCKKIHYTGIHELRYDLINAYNLYEDKVPICNDNTPLNQLIIDYKTIFERSIVSTEKSQVKKFIDILENANTIRVYGVGNSGITAQEVVFKFKRIGLNILCQVEYHLMMIDIIMANENDVVIAITQSGTSDEIINTLKLAKTKNIKAIVISNYHNTPAADLADCIIMSINHQDLETNYAISSIVPQLFIIDMLYQAFILQNYSHYSSIYNLTVKALKK